MTEIYEFTSGRKKQRRRSFFDLRYENSVLKVYGKTWTKAQTEAKTQAKEPLPAILKAL